MEKYVMLFNCCILIFLASIWSSKGWQNKLFKCVVVSGIILSTICVLSDFGYIIKI